MDRARFRLMVALAGLAALLPSPAVAAPDLGVQQVERSLAATQSMIAGFIQTDGKGRQLAGRLTLKRPGRIRFEYGAGADMLLVGNGSTLNFLDYAVGQKSSWPIAKSPLAILLSDRPDLGRIARPVATKDPRVVLIRARDARRPEFGTLILAFVRAPAAPGGLQLEGWTAIDAQNRKTTVKLDRQRYNVTVPETIFQFAEPRKRGRVG